MRNIEFLFDPDIEAVFVVINGLSVRERVRYYCRLEKFVKGLPYHCKVCTDANGIPDALCLFR